MASETSPTDLPTNPDGSPRFSPKVERLNTIVKRTINTGKYESFEISTMLESAPDPRFSARQNITNIQTVVVEEVNRMADLIVSQLKPEGGQ